MNVIDMKNKIKIFALQKGYKNDENNFITEVSKRYHYYESQIYNEIHPEIFNEEKYHIKKILKYLKFKKNIIRILNYGCGTGFEALELYDFLKKDNLNVVLLCIDQSLEMLNICKKNFSKIKNWKIRFSNDNYTNIKGKYDLILTNSLVHHIVDVDNFIFTIFNLLNDNGYYLMGHEPNELYYLNNEINKYHNIIYNNFIREFIRFILNIIKKNDTIADKVSNDLLKEKIILKPLNYFEIQALVDIHVMHPKSNVNFGLNGFNINKIQKKFSNFKIIKSITYNYLGKRKLPKKFDKYREYLKNKYPNDGLNFCCLFQKRVRDENDKC